MITETKIPTLPENTNSSETTPSLSPKNNKSGKGKIKFLFLAIFSLLISITTVIWLDQIHKPSDSDRIELEDLEGKMMEGIPLLDWEKTRFCELLDKVKKVKLYACKENSTV